MPTRLHVAASLCVTAALALAGCGSDSKTSDGGTAAKQGTVVASSKILDKCTPSYLQDAKAPVDTKAYKEDGDWVLGVAANTLTGSGYIVYFFNELKYAASQDSRFKKVIMLDAAFDASKQVSDIESLIRQKVSAIVVSPTDNKAIAPALAKAHDAGIPVINATGGYSPSPDVTADVQVDVSTYTLTSAMHFMESLGGKGKITQVLNIPGTLGDSQQDAALKCVLGFYPDVELLDSQPTQYATPQTQTAANAWVQRFPKIDGVFSLWAETSIGVVNAFKAAGRLDQIKISPGNQGNGWLKFLAANPKHNLGGVSFPVTLGKDTVPVVADILSGKPVPRGTFVGAEYIPPKEMAALADESKPDSYWANDMPASFQP